MTSNYERIKQMSVEDMAKLFYNSNDYCEKCKFCPTDINDLHCPNYSNMSCEEGIKQWLESEAESEK